MRIKFILALCRLLKVTYDLECGSLPIFKIVFIREKELIKGIEDNGLLKFWSRHSYFDEVKGGNIFDAAVSCGKVPKTQLSMRVKNIEKGAKL